MRRVSGWWGFGVAAAIIACCGVAAAGEQRQSPRADAESAKKVAPLEKPALPDSPKKAPKQETASSLSAALRQAAEDRAKRYLAITPIAFTSKEGKKGWKARIPGSQALTAAAVADGKVFIGGGYRSNNFFALDAATGESRWHYTTVDPGPTAPSVYRGYVSFETESCELMVFKTSGELVWKKWLGAPMITQPAVAEGEVIASFPVCEADRRQQQQQYLAAFAIKSGEELWRKKIDAQVISAPVIENRQVLLATADGSLHCFRLKDGKAIWTESGINATSAPTIWSDRCWFGQRQERATTAARDVTIRQTEQVACRALGARGDVYGLGITNRRADYLGAPRTVASAGGESGASKLANLGSALATATPAGRTPPANDDEETTAWLSPSSAALLPSVLQTSNPNLGIYGKGFQWAHDLWAYQGSRPLFYEERLYAAMGDSLSCIDMKAKKVLWKRDFRPEKGNIIGGRPVSASEKLALRHPTITPPALVNHKVFVGTSYGELLCLSAVSGETLWTATIGHSIAAQPVVAAGRVYVSTRSGVLYCLETGDPKDDGWLMWGANPAHTGRVANDEPLRLTAAGAADGSRGFPRVAAEIRGRKSAFLLHLLLIAWRKSAATLRLCLSVPPGTAAAQGLLDFAVREGRQFVSRLFTMRRSPTRFQDADCGKAAKGPAEN